MKAVVFDMDGVLFDTEKLCMNSWLHVGEQIEEMRSKGIEDMKEVFTRCIGLNNNDTWKLVQKHYGDTISYDKFREKVSVCFWEHIDKEGVPMKDGVEKTLAYLQKSDMKIGLATSSNIKSVTELLTRAGIIHFFQTIVTGDMVECSKPKPDIYLMACQKLDVEPEEAYAIEDSPNGIRSAYEAGMKPIMVPDLLMPDEEMKEKSHFICGSLTEFLQFFGKRSCSPAVSLGTPRSTAQILQKYEFRAKKKYGQNFLVDANILNKIIQASNITRDDWVLEIGPGIGTMTQYLAEYAGAVTAVEIDKALIPILEETLIKYDNVSIINADILKLDVGNLVQEHSGGRFAKAVANLPYYITTPIVMGLLEGRVPLHSITFMVQKEVADRMWVGPGTKDYGALSLAVQYYAKPEIIARVPGSCFLPPPSIESTIIKLTLHEEAPVKVADEKFMFALIRASFNQRRKTLANGIANAPGLNVSRERVKEALLKMNLSVDIRGETLDLEKFAMLSNLLME